MLCSEETSSSTPGKAAQLGFHPYAVVVGVFHDPLGHGDVLFKGMVRTVDHHGGEAAVHAGLAQLEAVAVVQVQADRQAGLSDGGLYQLDQIGMVSIGPSALGDLEDQGGVDLFGRSVIPWTISMLLTLNAPIAYPPL